jgi:hypothetical protein
MRQEFVVIASAARDSWTVCEPSHFASEYEAP